MRDIWIDWFGELVAAIDFGIYCVAPPQNSAALYVCISGGGA
jgi:hypothetical protein